MPFSIAYIAPSDLGMAIPVRKDRSKEEVAFNLSMRISSAHFENVPAACHLFQGKEFSSVKKNNKKKRQVESDGHIQK